MRVRVRGNRAARQRYQRKHEHDEDCGQISNFFEHQDCDPARATVIRKRRLRPASRPVASYHSAAVCEPPPFPPPPIETAGMPSERGIFASVELLSSRERLPRKVSTLRIVSSRVELSGSLPEGRTPSDRRVAFTGSLFARATAFSSRTPDCTASFSADSMTLTCDSCSERRSTFTEALDGMEFTEVPPSMTPKL